MGRTQFTFYESYYKALSRIKKKADRADAFDAICQYALYGESPDTDSLPDSVAIAFELIRPTLDASRRKAEGGAKSTKASAKTKVTSHEDADKISIRYAEDIDKMSIRYREDIDNKKENKKEKENEYEIEGESECYTPAPFAPPSLEEVQEFCQEEKLNIDPARFFNYYEGRGWMLGNQPMVNWKAVLKSWGDDKKPANTGAGGLDPMLKRVVDRRIAKRDEQENEPCDRTKRAIARLMAGSCGQEEE